MRLAIYTDGSYVFGDDSNGGCAAYLQDRDTILSGECPYSITSFQTELYAAIMSLENITTPSDIIIYTDNKQLCRAVNKIDKLKNTKYKHQYLWRRLYCAIRKHTSVKSVWVKGHNTNPRNELADLFASCTRAVSKCRP